MSFWRKFKNWFKAKAPVVKKPKPIVVDIPGHIDDNVQSHPEAPQFKALWDSVEIDPDRILEVRRVCEQIDKFKSKYSKVAAFVGCPVWLVAVYHYRESSLNFSGVLHNGQRIIGTGKKTTWVPKGRGPFFTWEDAAIDALTLKKYHTYKAWDIATCLRRAEQYNGLGYRYKIGDRGVKEYSPYVWAATSHHDETGKYFEDGKYGKHRPERQLGVAAIAKGLVDFKGWIIN